MDFVNNKRIDLNKLTSEYCNLLKKQDKTVEQKNRLKEINLEINEIRKDILTSQKFDKENYTSYLSNLLPERTKEEHLYAEQILNDDTEFPYQSDKIKAFIKAGIQSQIIVQILNQRTGFDIKISYVESIKTKLLAS